MSAITDTQITEYVEAHIGTFHDKRLEALTNLDLSELLVKNPYLLRSKNLVVAGDLVKSVLDAYLSSQEETLFGDFLEGLAIYVAERVHGGMKSSTTGIDLEFAKEGARYIVSIKSGPNWGNSSQVTKLESDFTSAARTIRQGNTGTRVIAVNGCCYGRDLNPDKGSYFKYCGQDFWELISGDKELYTRIIEPLGHNAKQRNDDFSQRYGAVVNRFTRAFTEQFCDDSGAIDWGKLVRYNSAATPFLSLPASKRAVNRLPTAVNICDVLRQWNHIDLADWIEAFVEDRGGGEDDPSLNLGSLRGFLMFLGTVQTEAGINLSVTPERLIVAEWAFDDDRSTRITFLDVDRISIAATNVDGKPVAIRNSQRVTRNTATRRLLEQGLFRSRESTP